MNLPNGSFYDRYRRHPALRGPQVLLMVGGQMDSLLRGSCEKLP